MDNDTRLRLLYIEKMLQDTDEQHSLTNADIMQVLEEKYHITTHRQTIAADIDLLIQSGMEIEVTENKPKKYYLNDYARTFSLPELKMLVDAVASSKFITKSKSDNLIKKISTLGTPSTFLLFKEICGRKVVSDRKTRKSITLYKWNASYV